MFMNFPVCVPTVSEQSAIVTHIENESFKFGTLTTEAQRAIDLLQERRTALISAAVTGQIDVRNHSPKPVFDRINQTPPN
jgi:type I restriction enzyme S subunit